MESDIIALAQYMHQTSLQQHLGSELLRLALDSAAANAGQLIVVAEQATGPSADPSLGQLLDVFA
jgi:Putative motility protein